MYLSQSTDIQIMVGPFIDITNEEPDDGITVTGINVDIYQGVSKTTLTITASGGSNDMVSTGSGGMYSLELTAANTTNQGHFTLVAYLNGYYVVRQNYFIIDQPSFDSIINGGVADEVWQTEFSPLVAIPPIDSSTNNTLVLDVDPGDYPDDYFTGLITMVWVLGNPYKQTRLVTNYVASTTTLTIDADWDVNPDSTYTSTFWPFQLSESGSIDPVDVNVVQWDGDAVVAPDITGIPKVDVTHWNSSPVFGAGIPQVNVVKWIDENVGVFGEDVWLNSSYSPIIRANSIADSTSSTVTLDAGADSTDDAYNSYLIVVISISNPLLKEAFFITDYVGSTQVATLDHSFSLFTPVDGDDIFAIYTFRSSAVTGTVDANLISVNGTTQTADVIEEVFVTDGATVKNSFADALLKRDFSAITGEASRCLLKAARFLMNRWSISGTTLTIYKEDDSTPSHTTTLTPTPGADPITGSDTN